MDPRQRQIRQYPVVVAAGVFARPAPAVGNRVMLLIQNTGSQPGLVRFGTSVRSDLGDLQLASGEKSPLWNIPDTTPNEALNFFSTFGTTFAVLEIVEPLGTQVDQGRQLVAPAPGGR
jgi:hypothetical protein